MDKELHVLQKVRGEITFPNVYNAAFEAWGVISSHTWACDY